MNKENKISKDEARLLVTTAVELGELVAKSVILFERLLIDSIIPDENLFKNVQDHIERLETFVKLKIEENKS
jgi:hypothetical protein